MVRNKRQLLLVGKIVRLSVIGMVLAGTATAQTTAKRQKYEDLAAQYKSEPAIYTNVTERLVIKEEDGHLAAKSEVSMEKLFISALSVNTYNTDDFYYGDFFQLTEYDGRALIPTQTDYRTIRAAGFGEGNPSHSFMEDTRRVVAYYSGLTKGAITRTSYSIEYPDLTLLHGHFFQENVRILKGVYEVVAPAYVKMNFLVKGVDTSMIRRSVEERNGNIIYRFTADNTPAFRGFDKVPSVSYYLPHVIPSIASFRMTGARKDSVMLSNTDNYYKYDYAHVRGINLKTDSMLDRTVKELTRNAYSDREKAANIYKWVQDNMHYVAFECGLEGFVPRQADSVYKRKYGDCKDMASIIMAMCRKAGLQAYFVSIGTKERPYTHDELHSALLYDHMIAAVKLGSEWVFLDGTDKHLPFGENRADLQGKEALIAIDAKHYEVVKIPEAPAEKSVVTDNTVISINNDKVTGTVTQRYSGYDAWRLIHYMANYNRKAEKDKLVRQITMRGSDKYLIPRYDIYAQETGNMDVNLNGEFSVGNYVHQVGKQTIVNMNLKRTFADMRVNDSGRNVAVYHDHKKVVRESVVLNVPDGYRVSYLPKAAQGSVDGLWNYKITYTEDKRANKVTLTKEYALNAMTVKPSQFVANNRLVDDLKKQYRETVVLTAKK
ncbi:MAG: transglutaminase-like domain-containing protein [Bacteroidota bacterium]